MRDARSVRRMTTIDDLLGGASFAQFTGRTRTAVTRAADEARASGRNEVGTEHLLLAIVQDPAALANVALDQLGISADALRAAVAERTRAGRGVTETSEHTDMPLGSDARAAIDGTFAVSLAFGHNYIGTEHLLIAILHEGTGEGGKVLRGMGVTHNEVSRKVEQLIAGSR
jgi:ATP-dependent Clp protease ATP-binding subunit ClpA